MNKYCWRFGEHRSDPCGCGWSSKTDPQVKIEQLAAENAKLREELAESDGWTPDEVGQYSSAIQDRWKRECRVWEDKYERLRDEWREFLQSTLDHNPSSYSVQRDYKELLDEFNCRCDAIEAEDK